MARCLLLILLPFFLPELCHHFVYAMPGLPGGGTSLAFTNDVAVALIPDFTYLAGATTYSMEAWVYSTSTAVEPAVLVFAQPDNVEFWTFEMGDVAFFALDGNVQTFPYQPGFVGWRHVAMTVADGDVRGYVRPFANTTVLACTACTEVLFPSPSLPLPLVSLRSLSH